MGENPNFEIRENMFTNITTNDEWENPYYGQGKIAHNNVIMHLPGWVLWPNMLLYFQSSINFSLDISVKCYQPFFNKLEQNIQ
jgi:hypothetical protein